MVCKSIDSYFFLLCSLQKDNEHSGQKKKKRGILKPLGQPELAMSWVSGARREREKLAGGKEGFK